MRYPAVLLCLLLVGSACGGSSSSEIEALEEQVAGLQEQIAVLGEQLDATPTLRDGSGASDPGGSYTDSNKFRDLIPTRGDPSVLTALTTTTAPTVTVPTTTTAPTVTVPTTTTVKDTSIPKESSGNEPGSCVEVFVFEESADPSDQSSLFAYAFSADDPSVTVRLSLLPCSDLEYIATRLDGPKVNVSSIVDLGPDDHQMFWLDRSGFEVHQRNMDAGNPQEMGTYVGHPFVIRVAQPQPEVTLAASCESTQMRKEFIFRKEVIGGWTVYFECPIEYTPNLMSTIRSELTSDLEYINLVLPEQILTRLQATQLFFVASNKAKPRVMVTGGGGVFMFPPPLGNLASENMPEVYGGSIVIDAYKWSNTRRGQPAGLTLHELAHAWHCMNWPCFSNDPLIADAYEAAMTSGIYDLVDRNDGSRGKAYAASKKAEYFAELTEAWFWENDYYPYNREQLLTHDPVGAAAVEAAWTVNG